MPYAFTEHGALMAASVLNTPRAVQVSLYVVRVVFDAIRELVRAPESQRRRIGFVHGD
jgi:hypothetical protein